MGGGVNLISMDDYIVDTTLRKNSETTWTIDGKEYKGRYTSCCEGSYFLRGVLPVLFALREGNDTYILPKRSDCILLSGKAQLTIVEGIGTVFLPADKDVVKIWFECDKDTEISRRIERDTKLTKEEIYNAYEDRTSQFRANILPYKKDFDYIVDTSNS